MFPLLFLPSEEFVEEGKSEVEFIHASCYPLSASILFRGLYSLIPPPAASSSTSNEKKTLVASRAGKTKKAFSLCGWPFNKGIVAFPDQWIGFDLFPHACSSSDSRLFNNLGNVDILPSLPAGHHVSDLRSLADDQGEFQDPMTVTLISWFKQLSLWGCSMLLSSSNSLTQWNGKIRQNTWKMSKIIIIQKKR